MQKIEIAMKRVYIFTYKYSQPEHNADMIC